MATPEPDAMDRPAPNSGYDRVSVEDLAEEAGDAGFVDWLAEQIQQQILPYGTPLDGEGGLMSALVAAAMARVHSAPTGPVAITISYDPVRHRASVDLPEGFTRAMLLDACLAVALGAASLSPAVDLRTADGRIVGGF